MRTFCKIDVKFLQFVYIMFATCLHYVNVVVVCLIISSNSCARILHSRRLQKIAIFVDDIAKNYAEEFNDGPVFQTIERYLFLVYIYY